MNIKRYLNFFTLTLSAILFLASCSDDNNSLAVGENIIDDDHDAYYTEDLEILTETVLAEYVGTNNTGVALCGSYTDEYIGKVTANTVFKITPGIYANDSRFTDYNVVYDSLELLLTPSGYLYGDSTKSITLSVYEIDDHYDLDTVYSVYEGTAKYLNKSNYSHIDLVENSTPLLKGEGDEKVDTFTFIPEELYGEPVHVRMDDELGLKWFDAISSGAEDYTIHDGGSSEDFVKEIFNGITIRNEGDNDAIIGFKMSTDETSDTSEITFRMHYHTSVGLTEEYFDFVVYQPSYQYNQIEADFTGKAKALAELVPGGEGISSTLTDGMTFINSGIGLATKVDIPTLNEVYKFGPNFTPINFNLFFYALPHSFVNGIDLPTVLSVDKFQNNGLLSGSGVTSLIGETVSVSKTFDDERTATYGIPLTGYANEEKEIILGSEDHNSLLIRSTSSGTYAPNVNRIVLGDANLHQSEMEGKMYYTTFEK